MKPEEEVIEQTLKEMFPQGTPQSARFHEESHHIWSALIEYWRTRLIPTPPEFEDGIHGKEALYDTTEQFGPPVEGDLPLGAQVFDGSPYIHGGSARTYEWPLPFDPQVAGEDVGTDEDLTYKIELFENNALNMLDELSEQLANIQDLPMWNEKESKHLEKAWNQIYKTIRSKNAR